MTSKNEITPTNGDYIYLNTSERSIVLLNSDIKNPSTIVLRPLRSYRPVTLFQQRASAIPAYSFINIVQKTAGIAKDNFVTRFVKFLIGV